VKRTGRISIPLAVAVGLALVASPAAGARAGRSRLADTPDRYAATAESSALKIDVVGQGLTVGSGKSTVSSSPDATATGQGLLLATQSFGASSATASTPGQTAGSATPSCSPLALPAGSIPGITLTTACSTSTAAISDAGPTSKATGQSLTLKAGSGALLDQTGLDALVDQLVDTITTGLAPVLTALPPLPLPSGGSLGAPVAVDLLKTELLTTLESGNLLEVTGGDAFAQTSATASTVTATSHSDGAVLSLLDRGTALGGPVLTITIGESSATATRDRASGTSNGTFTAVPVTVKVAPDIAALLGLPTNTFSVPGGQAVDLPLPSPLNSSIILSSGTKAATSDGEQVRSAALELDLAKGLPNGGIVVGLSAGSAAVAGAVATAVEPTSTTPAPVVEDKTLPRTGVNQDQLDFWGFGLLAAAACAALLVVRANKRASGSRTP
jgi:hypothetical protein